MFIWEMRAPIGCFSFPLYECGRGWDALTCGIMSWHPRHVLASPSFRLLWYSFCTHDKSYSNPFVRMCGRDVIPQTIPFSRERKKDTRISESQRSYSPLSLHEPISSRKERPNSCSKFLEQHLIINRQQKALVTFADAYPASVKRLMGIPRPPGHLILWTPLV